MGNILIVAETTADGKIREASYELVSFAKTPTSFEFSNCARCAMCVRGCVPAPVLRGRRTGGG